MQFYFWRYIKGYQGLREKHPSLYQVKAHSLFYTTQLKEFVCFSDLLKQVLEFFHMIMYSHCELSKDIFIHFLILLLSFMLWNIHISGHI